MPRVDHQDTLAYEQGRKALSISVTAGQHGDSPQFSAVLDGISVLRPVAAGPDQPGAGAGRQGRQQRREPRLPA